MHTLIIAEKPSVAEKMAYALSMGEVKKIKKNGASYFLIERKGKKLIIAPAVGHLFVLHEKRFKDQKGWKYPTFEVEWVPVFRAGQKNKKLGWVKGYYKNIEEASKGAHDFISACDYDIEGSLIAYNILRFICKKKNAKRMKFSTLTKEEIINSYENAMPELDFEHIYAGLARHTLDWYFGINLSRALTLALKSAGRNKVLSTGRVQGPTLKLVYEREKEIENFVPKKYWKLFLKGKMKGNDIVAWHVSGNFFDKERAKMVIEKCKGRARVASVENKTREIPPPFPFDLTTLQREAYNSFGYTPKHTLDIAQRLYEASLISYPRTSSQKLKGTHYRDVIKKLKKVKDYEKFCLHLYDKSNVYPTEGKKEDPAHPAIYPTGVLPKGLSNEERNVYDLIARRFIACFYEKAVIEERFITIDVNGEMFRTMGIKVKENGWLDVYGKYHKIKEVYIPNARVGDRLDSFSVGMEELETKPKPRYSQASLLSEMERLGLGTKGTRAQIIQTLYDRGYIEERKIRITRLGRAVVEILEKYCPEIISEKLTRKFEEKMEMIMNGEKSMKNVEEALEEAREFLKKILPKIKEREREIGRHLLKIIKEDERDRNFIGNCSCGGELMIIKSRGKRFVGCSNYPKCNNIFPLPKDGFLRVLDERCETCGLKHVWVKRKGKRGWKLCVKCGVKGGDEK